MNLKLGPEFGQGVLPLLRQGLRELRVVEIHDGVEYESALHLGPMNRQYVRDQEIAQKINAANTSRFFQVKSNENNRISRSARSFRKSSSYLLANHSLSSGQLFFYQKTEPPWKTKVFTLIPTFW